MSDDREAIAKARIKAMNLLAQREYARQELQAKLAKALPDCQVDLASVLDTLEQDGLLSEQRFVESFINGRVSKGQGPTRISMELRRRGVAESLIDEGLCAAGVDWVKLAKQVRMKKFGKKRFQDFQQRAKVGRFLQYRGFNSDDIASCLEEE